MNAVIGMTELALGTELNSEQQEYLSTVRMSAESLLELLNDILDLSKIEAGRIELDEIDFDLADVVRDALRSLAVKAHSKGLELATRLPMDLPHHLHGDPLRLRQVLINLVGNAIKFTERGEVVVEFRSFNVQPQAPATSDEQSVRTSGDATQRDDAQSDASTQRDSAQNDDAAQPRDSSTGAGSPDAQSPSASEVAGACGWALNDLVLHFTVRDTGVGIPPERIDHIFEAFTQVDASTTRQFGGTGLGLTITAELLRLMGGHIRVESTVGTGSTFHVSIPLRLAEHEPVPFGQRLDVSREFLENRTVLVVDDNATNRRILEEMLGNWGLRPRVADGAAAALKELEAAAYYGHPFDLLIIDAMMPDTDGFGLIEQLRQRSDLCGDAVMMLSSADRSDSAKRCRELGVGTYLVKPVSQSGLLEAIVTMLDDSENFGANESDGSGQSELSGRTPAGPAVDERALVPLHILITDDHEANRVLAEKILAKRGHTSTQAANGRQVLDRLENESFDLILMDVQMPEMDGLQATSAIRLSEESSGNHIPIVALTAHAMKGDREKCLAAGMDAYLSKPLRAKELIALVEKLCEPITAARIGTAAAFRPATEVPSFNAQPQAPATSDAPPVRRTSQSVATASTDWTSSRRSTRQSHRATARNCNPPPTA